MPREVEHPMTATRPPDPPALIDALRDVYDPCCADRGISIVDMGVVEDVRVDGSHVAVDLVPTTGLCPFVASMSRAIPDRLREIEGVESVEVEVVWGDITKAQLARLDGLGRQARLA